MHQALPYWTWVPTIDGGSSAGLSSATIETSDDPMNPGVGMNDVTCMTKMVSENAVIVLGRRGCCMCHVVMRLLLGLGVNPIVFEVDEEDEVAVVGELSRVIVGNDAKEGWTAATTPLSIVPPVVEAPSEDDTQVERQAVEKMKSWAWA
ncbi:monothiol glutaredoxin-S5-like [Vitis riparia]|uniref:monothiol glutaredoxin-S5-like n=1 Tax=Vitis riparia TaxID=96939 RepID=UPI00155A78D6|nr:monothiol glutaredoxin-S5-like [Vitis riparia]